MARTRPDGRVIPAGLGPMLVDGATPGLFIEVVTIIVGPAGQGEERVLEVEMLDDSELLKPPSQQPGFFFGLEGIEDCHPHQVRDPHLHRQPATPTLTGRAEAFPVAAPGFGPGYVGSPAAVPAFHLSHPLSAG
jgi:hypothetical protein